MTNADTERGGTPPRRPEQPAVVIRDKRRVDATGGGSAAKAASTPPAPAPAAEPVTETTVDLDLTTAPAEPDAGVDGTAAAGAAASAEDTVDGTSPGTDKETAGTTGGDDAGTQAGKETGAEGDVVAPADPPAAVEPDSAEDTEGAPVYIELEALRGDLDELTRDLQRVSAEYANYRKRVDRDRLLVSEQATGAVLTALLPVLDDLDRARAHGDLVGPFAAVAEQLSGALQKFGLTAFGEAGDAFDPSIHEAVSHTSSDEVTETTCVEIMRRGYLLGDRLLRPALVGVADPQ